MEQTHTSPATPSFRLRLCAQAERMIEAVESLPTPETAIEVQRFARALLAAEKVVSQICETPDAQTPPAPEFPKEMAETVMEDLRQHFRHKLDIVVTEWWDAKMAHLEPQPESLATHPTGPNIRTF